MVAGNHHAVETPGGYFAQINACSRFTHQANFCCADVGFKLDSVVIANALYGDFRHRGTAIHNFTLNDHRLGVKTLVFEFYLIQASTAYQSEQQQQ